MNKLLLISVLFFCISAGAAAKEYNYDTSDVNDLPPQCITLKAFVSTANNQYDMAYKGQKSLSAADNVVSTEIRAAFLKGTPEEYLNNGMLQYYNLIKRNGLEKEIAENRIYNLTGFMSREDLINIAKKIKNQALSGKLDSKQFRLNDETVINACLKKAAKLPAGSGADYYKAIDYSKRTPKK